MNVSPLDLRQQRFRTGIRGFDKVEVTALLNAVADDYEASLRETDRLRQELARAETLLKEHRESEKNLRTTLMAAQKLADEIKTNAEEEARRIVRAAEERASLMREKTQAQVEEARREIDALKLKRKDAETAVESTIQSLRHSLEFVRGQDARAEREEPIALKVIAHR